MPGDGHLDSVVAGDLEEDPGVGAALVGLAGGVLEAGPEPDAGGYLTGVPNERAHLRENRLVRGRHLHVREQRHVVACSNPIELRLEVGDQARLTAEDSSALLRSSA